MLRREMPIIYEFDVSGDWRQLCILVARLHSRPLDMQRPPWEMYVVEGLDNIEGIPEGAFALISKYHHAAIR